jgi:hypothetical protein
VRKLPRWALVVLSALWSPVAARAQGASIGVAQEPGGILTGRICVDLDGDGACGADEPGLAGARLRIEDGRKVVADSEGRFHVDGLAGRILRADRAAYGAHTISAEGLGAKAVFELAPRGAAQVELAVPVHGGRGEQGSVDPRGRTPPRLDREVIVWPLAGTAPAGARVRVGEVETTAAADGRWALDLPLPPGGTRDGLSVLTPEGGLALWALEVVVARPSSGAPRAYPSRPRLLASMTATPAGAGIVLVGTLAAGVELRAGGVGVRAGRGGFGVWVPAATPPEVVATGGGVSATARLEAGASGRLEWGLLGELELQAGGKAKTLASGRIAGSATGRWRGFGLEAGLDLDDRDRDAAALASPRDSLSAALVLDPRRIFVNAGDGGAGEDLNPGRGRIWARVEGHDQRLEVGATRSRLGAGALGAHDRTLHGARWEGEAAAGPVRLGGVILGGRVGEDVNGLAPGVPAQDVLAATGGSLFYLSHAAIVVGSEIVREEWRDPSSRLVVERRELVRGRDYELDAVGGRLLLVRPLPATRAARAIVGGDPFAGAEGWLVVDYLRAEGGAGATRGLAGAELRAAVGPLTLALGGAAESRPGADWERLRGAATVDLGPVLRARVEVAETEGELLGGEGARATSLDGGFRFAATAKDGVERSALAFHAGLEGEAGTVRWRGWWRERPRGYSDQLYSEQRAARERGVQGEGLLGPVALKLAWVDRRGVDPWGTGASSERDSDRAYAAAAYALGTVELTAEALHERLRLPEDGVQSAVGLRAAWRAGSAVTLEGSHLQAFGVDGAAVASTFTAAGGSLRTREGSLSVRAGWGPELGPRLVLSGERGDARTGVYGTLSSRPDPGGRFDGGGGAVGGRQRFEGGSLFTEQRVTQSPEGVVAGQIVGGTLEPSPGLQVTLSSEQGERLRADGTTIARGAGAVGAAWLRGALRLDGRAELRREGGGEQWIAGAGAEWGASRNLTFAARALLADGEISGRRAQSADGWLSAAWRAGPVSILGRLGLLRDEREGAVARDATTGAVAVALKAARRATIGLGIDGARQVLGGTRDDRIAGSARIAVEVTGPFDVALEYARRGSLDGLEIGDLHALRGEAGITAGGVRLALGYTLTGFRGTGLDPEEEEDGRFYLRAVLVR